jgi:hypothetical protein
VGVTLEALGELGVVGVVVLGVVAALLGALLGVEVLGVGVVTGLAMLAA